MCFIILAILAVKFKASDFAHFHTGWGGSSIASLAEIHLVQPAYIPITSAILCTKLLYWIIFVTEGHCYRIYSLKLIEMYEIDITSTQRNLKYSVYVGTATGDADTFILSLEICTSL